jgi:surfactin synthase thioesterase subunit
VAFLFADIASLQTREELSKFREELKKQSELDKVSGTHMFAPQIARQNNKCISFVDSSI